MRYSDIVSHTYNTMKPLYTVTEIRAIERACTATLAPGGLMQRAGAAAAAAALDLLGSERTGAKVLLLAGPGNNGGDALEVAAHLADAGLQVTVWQPAGADTGAMSLERQQALARARASAAHFVELTPEAVASAAVWQLVVDGLVGIGLTRPLAGPMRHMAELVNALACPVLALDVPSGLDADTGAVVGPHGVALRACRTATFIGDKVGLHTNDGQDYAGAVQVCGLDLDATQFAPASAHLNHPRHFARHLQVRRQNSHKGSYGNVTVLGGAGGMTGAAVLAGRSALLAGAGRVYLAFLDNAPEFDPAHPELMCRHAADVELDGSVLVAGPGLGTSHKARDLLLRVFDSAAPLLLDADALNLVAAQPELQTTLALRAKTTILTPHPLEAARLLGISAAAVQADRLAAARQLAAQMNVIVVLKGSGTVVAAPDGAVVVNTSGNPALATAGTGDVLSGLCGSLLAQGWPEWEAALAAVWLHGAAADDLVASGAGPIGLSASELVPAIRAALNRLVASNQKRH